MRALVRQFQKLPISEWLLIQRVKNGDAEAFGTVYSLYLDKIYRYIFFRVQQNTQLAEDITEIVFLKAWEKIELYKKEGGSFSSWLYTIARNTIIDQYRAEKERVTLSEHHIDDTQHIEDQVFQAVEMERVKQAMRSLTPEQQEILVLKFMNDLSNKEIAKILNKREDAIRALQYRALGELRKILNT